MCYEPRKQHDYYRCIDKQNARKRKQYDKINTRWWFSVFWTRSLRFIHLYLFMKYMVVRMCMALINNKTSKTHTACDWLADLNVNFIFSQINFPRYFYELLSIAIIDWDYKRVSHILITGVTFARFVWKMIAIWNGNEKVALQNHFICHSWMKKDCMNLFVWR